MRAEFRGHQRLSPGPQAINSGAPGNLNRRARSPLRRYRPDRPRRQDIGHSDDANGSLAQVHIPGDTGNPPRDRHFRVRERQSTELGLNDVYVVSVLAQAELSLNRRRKKPSLFYPYPVVDRSASLGRRPVSYAPRALVWLSPRVASAPTLAA